MKKLFATAMLLLLSTSVAFSGQQPVNWIAYSSPEGRYQVSLPQQPKVSRQESTTADGEKFPQYLTTVTEADGLIFMIGYFDVVPGTAFSADVARDAMVKTASGRLLGENAITLGGFPGRDLNIALKISTSSTAGESASQIDYLDRARIYEAGKRIYILQAIFPKSLESDVNSRITRFFDSFQVVKAEGSTTVNAN
jgi:hypothetical protein